MGWSYTVAELARIVGAPAPAALEQRFGTISTDTRTLQPGAVFFALNGEHYKGAAFLEQAFQNGACAAVTDEPSQAGPCLVVPDAQAALQEFAAHHRRRFDLPLLALTGSCGKTSSKEMIAAVLETRYAVVKTQGNLNNEIGCPLSLLQLDETTQAAVIEMGANHMGEIARLCELARPTEAAITLVAPAHLEGFGSIENVAKAKGEIVEGLSPGGTYYVNADDPFCCRIADRHSGNKVYFGSRGDVVLRRCEFNETGEMVLDIDPIGELRLPLVCRAHASNVLLAVAVALQHGVTHFEGPLRAACAAPARFKVLRIGPIEVIDDTYNANPASMKASLAALADRPSRGARFAALGEMLELGDTAQALHREVGEFAGRAGVTHLFARGPHACDTIAGAQAAAVPHVWAVEDHQAIAQTIHDLAQPGDVVLVKGSRGMQMERVVEALRRLYG